MKLVQNLFSSKLGIALVLLLVAASLSGVVTLSNSVETQSILHQKSLTPVFDLVTQELVKPFYIAETVSRASPLKLRMNEDQIDQQKIHRKLSILEKEFGMKFFVASEKSRIQYNSDGSSLPLEEGKVEWYFRAKDNPVETFGTLGNRNDVHIYFDLKVHNQKGEFLGFIGVGKRLETFLKSFDDFKRQFGYAFVITDNNNNVVLSSDKSQLADGKRILNLAQLDWYKNAVSNGVDTSSFNNKIVQINNADFLIAEVQLRALNWRLYVLNPLHLRQVESLESYLYRLINIALFILIFAILGKFLLNYVQSEFAKKHQKDPLTQLPNRANLTWRFNQMRKNQQEICTVIVDIDHFKQINDNFGHAKGDLILQEVAKILKSQIRAQDAIGRWGGEEFVMILATSDLLIAQDVAERARRAISDKRYLDGSDLIKVTASFGIAFKESAYKLEDTVALADDALYQAKKNGRNQVVFNTGSTENVENYENSPSHA